MKEQIPIINQTYHFFDDGKITNARHHIAVVINVIKPENTKNINIIRTHHNNQKITLYDIWKEEINNHRQTHNFSVANNTNTTPGQPWLYAENTDAFIQCKIPTYDQDDVYFVRMTNGEWFSLDTTHAWMTGKLDVSGKLYQQLQQFNQMYNN
jgi:hypothetical protein